MTTLYVGKDHAYRNEFAVARAESAHAAVHAPRAETLDWDASLLFLVRWDGGEKFTTDIVDVHSLVSKHPSCDVRVITVAD